MKIKKTFKAKITELNFRILRFLIKPIIIKNYSPIILHRENVKEKDSIVFTSNHCHKMDQYFLAVSTKRISHWGAKEEYYRNIDSLFGKPTKFNCFLTKLFLNSVGSICVDRYGDSSKAKEEFEKYLNMGSCIGLFPEGTRNKTEEILLPFKFGAVKAASKTNSWIQPVSITGDIKKGTKNLIVNFRKPFKVGNMPLDEANEKLRNEILDGIEENSKYQNVNP